MSQGNLLDSGRALVPVSTTTTAKAIEFDTRPDKIWMNPISMSQLQAAVKKRAKTVHLNGREYAITYGINFRSKVMDEDRECVKLKRTDGGYAPFGYVSMARIMAFTFEGDD